jgi:hypothetical protein
MDEELRSVVLGTAGLTVAALAAGLVTVSRGPVETSRTELESAARVALLTTLVQLVHFAEELATGFHARFPEQLGLVPWRVWFFVAFNLFWLAVWAVSSWGLLAGRRLALAALWFLGIAGVANGIAHPLLAARGAGYFPGLVTSPVLGLVSLLLLRRLARLTRRRAA